jgi:DtxR family transcriptional regulator, manganese transport regulator
MPEAPAQASRFGKTRAERSTALLEDYVELIADLFAAKDRKSVV